MNFVSNPQAFFSLGEHTLAFTVLRGRGQQTGAVVTIPAAKVAKWRDGLCVYFGGTPTGRTRSDLGVSEGELEPIDP
jgi:hypothetical protein